MHRWRRRLLALVFLHLSPPMRTHPGCFKTKFKPPGSGCRCLRPSTRLLLHPGCGPDGPRRNHTCCQSVPACSSAGCLSRTSRPYRTLPRTIPRRPCTCTTYCSCCSRLWNALSYYPPPPQVRHRRVSPDSSSPTRRLSPPAKRSRLGGHHAPCGSSSSEGHEQSPRARLPRRSRSPLPRRRGPSTSSSSHHRRSRDSPAPSRWPLEAGRTRRLAGQPSLSPRRQSPASQRRSRRSSWGRQSSPPLRTRAPNRHSSLSSSRSPSPRGHRSCSMSSHRQRSWSSSRDRISRPHAADQHLLRLRIDDGDQHPRDSPIPEQSTTVDDSQLSAEKVQKLFADLLDPPALSHYADPSPDSTPSNQLVPYDPTTASSSAAQSGINIEPLEMHGLCQNYQSFHRLSGDQDKEACTAAYYDLTNLMLSQTPEEVSLINVSSSRPKLEGPYSSFLAATDELKKNQDKIHLQWPPLQTHNKVIKRTLSLYQHGPQPKSGTSDQWPPPPVRNPWDKDFVPKDFPTTHKIPSNMPKRWDLHASSPLMLRPPQSTAVTEVPDSDIAKCPSWLEAFAARSSHTSTMSATSMGVVYNLLLKISRFLRASAAKNNIQKDITLVNVLIQRANSMALEAHLMAHDAGVTSTELFTHLHMFRRHTVLEFPTVDLPSATKIGYWSCQWAATTYLVLLHVKSMSGNGTLRKKISSSSPGSLMSVIKETKLRKSLPHRKVVIHAPSPTGLLWTLSLDLGPKTRTINSWVSPFADLPNSPPTSLVWAHNPKIKPLTETRKPLPLTGPIPATKDNAVKTGSPKVPSQLFPQKRSGGGGGSGQGQK